MHIPKWYVKSSDYSICMNKPPSFHWLKSHSDLNMDAKFLILRRETLSSTNTLITNSACPRYASNLRHCLQRSLVWHMRTPSMHARIASSGKLLNIISSECKTLCTWTRELKRSKKLVQSQWLCRLWKLSLSPHHHQARTLPPLPLLKVPSRRFLLWLLLHHPQLLFIPVPSAWHR